MDNLETMRDLAAQKRVDAKRILGEALGRSGYLNPELPMSRFVDTLMGAILLETSIIVETALRNLNDKNDEKQPTDKQDL
jgi:hypothetical protein